MSSLRDQKRIKIALDYIDQHLTERLTLEQVAGEACLSEFHFHRLFKTATNETLNQYIQRKRLTKSMYCLHYYQHLSVADIANNCGFSSQANFSKAFSKYYGFSPRQFKSGQINAGDGEGQLFQKTGNKLAPESIYFPEDIDHSVESHFEYHFEVKNIEQQKFIYVASEQGYVIEGIGNAWAKLRQQIHLDKLEQGEKVGICHDNQYLTPSELCRYEAAIRIPSFEGLEHYCQRTIDAGVYLNIHIKGPISKLGDFYRYVMADYVPKQKLIPRSSIALENYKTFEPENDFIEVMTQIAVI